MYFVDDSDINIVSREDYLCDEIWPFKWIHTIKYDVCTEYAKQRFDVCRIVARFELLAETRSQLAVDVIIYTDKDVFGHDFDLFSIHGMNPFLEEGEGPFVCMWCSDSHKFIPIFIIKQILCSFSAFVKYKDEVNKWKNRHYTVSLSETVANNEQGNPFRWK